MQSESGGNRNVIDEVKSWDIQRDLMEGQSGVTGNIIDDLHFSVIERVQMED